MAETLSKAKLSNLRRLKQKKRRLEEGRFLIEGWHLLDEAMRAGIPIDVLVYDDTRSLNPGDRGILDRALELAKTVYLAADGQMRALGETKTSAGVVAALQSMRENWGELRANLEGLETGLVVAMDGVSDPGNCGAILRSADWFGAEAILLGADCPDKENPKALRASMGGIFHAGLSTHPPSLESRLRELRNAGFEIVVATLGEASVPLPEFTWPPKSILVVGNEARGVDESIAALADSAVRIPRFGNVESLNAAMAASILLSHWRMQY